MSDPRPVAAVPSTIWACGRDVPDRSDFWPAPVLRRAVAEFSEPDARVVLLAASPAQQLAARRARTALADTGRTASTVTVADSPATPGRGEVADLVIASLLSDPDTPPLRDIYTRLAFTAADQLRGGAILAVLTRCERTRGGVLDDATGPVVAAAQAADLLYLSHIVAVPICADVIPVGAREQATVNGHRIVHIDVTVFLRPDDQHLAQSLNRAA
ncbi:hypothetical protein [Nocardia sp. NPDC052566]|uniref:hypothetical protein n=1 Tax=Nocardia sp. NPDC052566 TaxID=3364330 RepID=UPI0037C9A785